LSVQNRNCYIYIYNLKSEENNYNLFFEKKSVVIMYCNSCRLHKLKLMYTPRQISIHLPFFRLHSTVELRGRNTLIRFSFLKQSSTVGLRNFSLISVTKIANRNFKYCIDIIFNTKSSKLLYRYNNYNKKSKIT
jgi:hypothetical protein